ncbi:MAG: hypothetical protein WC089_02670 [Candidatus Paceibacterota bacterium]
MEKEIIKAGDIVEYLCICGLIHVKVLEVKKDGKLILNTRAVNNLLKPDSRGNTTVSLSKNVCVKRSRVKCIK